MDGAVVVESSTAASQRRPDEGAGGAGAGGAGGAGEGDPRQSLRDASIFANLDFEDVDGAGVPVGWGCLDAGGTQAKCRTSTTGAQHGQRALVLPSGWTAYQIAKAFDPTRGLRFDGFTTGGPLMPIDAAVYGRATSPSVVASLHVDGLDAAPDGFVPIVSRGAMPTAGAEDLLLVLANSTGMHDVSPAGVFGADGPDKSFDDLIAVQDEAPPPPKVGALLRGSHVNRFGLSKTAKPASMYVSLPADWASQTPLYLEMTVTPPEIVDHISYATEAEGNWGATIAFVAGAKAPAVEVRWDGVVLAQATADADLPAVFAAQLAPEQWLSSSGIIESSAPQIAAVAASLAPAGGGALATMQAVLDWTSTSISGGFAGALDATTVFDSRQGSCTGFANVAAALGRSLGVPTRHVTNMYVGESQDMHSIDEFYLGPDAGWRRVEPQIKDARVADDYGLIMRLVLPGDESPIADRPSPEGPLMLGIPEREFSESLSSPGAFAPSLPQAFPDCNTCNNHADPQADLRDLTPGAMTQVFQTARASWKKSQATYAATGGLPAAEMTTRRKALAARTIADLAALLAELP
jgi:hypothetical protein